MISTIYYDRDNVNNYNNNYNNKSYNNKMNMIKSSFTHNKVRLATLRSNS